MSHFICGFKSKPATHAALDAEFVRAIPRARTRDPIRLDRQSAYLTVYATRKAIPNTLITADDDKSWLAVIGTPLYVPASSRAAQALLAECLADPCRTVREKIDGQFVVVAYDGVNDRLIVAADMNNTTPVFYATTPDGVLLCSHELVLAKYLGAVIDPFGFAQTIQLGATWESSTRFRNIRKTVPCQVAVFTTDHRVDIRLYWRPDHEPIWTDDLDSVAERWLASLGEAVWKYYECAGRKPVLADFTAGEDARLLVAQCHKLGIPFTAQVTGLSKDVDVMVARRASRVAGFDLNVRAKRGITPAQLVEGIRDTIIDSDGYLDLYKACTDYATDAACALDDYSAVKYCGFPGGEAFRGAYYLRGKAFISTRRTKLDYAFFTRMKYLLDYHPGILRAGEDLLEWVYEAVERRLHEVDGFPIGTQIDHMLRVFQTCLQGLGYKAPLYLPLATNAMTRSIYSLSPRHKKGGRLTKACTEMLYPELARVRTQNRVPTIRRTVLRSPLFWPEHLATVRQVSSGAITRLLKWSEANKWYYGVGWNAPVVDTLLNTGTSAAWFASADTMATGYLYDAREVNGLLDEARGGKCRQMPVLGRILAQELAMRWVQGDRLS